MRLTRTPLLLEVFASAIGPGRTIAGGKPVKGATTTANFVPVALGSNALWGGRTWEGLLRKKLKRKKKKKGRRGSGRRAHELDSPLMPVGGVVAGMEIVRKMRKRLGLSEAVSSGVAQWPSDVYSSAYSVDLADFDHVAHLAKWRKECPNYHKIGHAAFCERCDEDPWKMPVGGAEWAKLGGWPYQNPIQGYPGWDTIPDSLSPRTPAEVWNRNPK